ncbi:DUF669 domain-containing protein [uncultured Ruminococcus sp.]|uniref:DUF669 domain-containing protein n=1 Tax=uncultured Ruminococcus sp. TaxID=165186 RepID=UPI0025FB0E2B|nr:DUF669 domain-containing protein [uncultured Ruminococcus sp.]
MGFKSNQSEAYQNGIKPEGDYECIIAAIEERTTKKGSMRLNFTLVIRNDVQGQKYGNACLFHTIWKKHEPNENDMQVEGYNFAQLMAMGKAAQLPDGKEYDSLKAYCTDLLNKCIRVNLKHESNPDYRNGEPQERINFVSPTKHPECRHKFKSSAPKSDSFANTQQTGFANTQQYANSAIGSLDDFEEVLSDDGVPF